MNLRYKLMQFMRGRYGVDGTYYVLLAITCIISFINCFIFYMPVRVTLQTIVYLLIFYTIFRILSKNITARSKENQRVMSVVYKVKNYIQTKRKRRADTTHIYKKCPSCKAVLRLPRRPGKHTTICPKCNKQFNVKVKK